MMQPSHRSSKRFIVLGGLLTLLFFFFSMRFLLDVPVFGGVESQHVRQSNLVSAKHFPVLDQGGQTILTRGAETLNMEESFYTANFNEDDTSTTIIFNVFLGEPEALEMQLEVALNQKSVIPSEIWVMCFNSPKRWMYEAVVDKILVKYPERKGQLVLTTSEFNYKFHGRFLLAYMATTKYVLIVDDDRPIDSTTVYDYIRYMKLRKGVWGNLGHLRASTFAGYKSWPKVGYNLSITDMEEQDYLCGMWFIEQSWLEYFMKERPPSWVTSEDMHLSHVMRKYLNLNTYGGKVALLAPPLPRKGYAATKGSALDLREFIFDHQLGRGNKVANVIQPIETLVYAESARDIEEFMEKLDTCPSESSNANPWCNVGKTAAVFRGAKEQNVKELIASAEKLCAKTNCEYFSVKPNIRHVIRYFNMQEGFGQNDVEIPFQTGVSDVMMSLVGILNNVLPKTLFVPDMTSVEWPESDTTKRNRLQIYHRTVLLAVDIHRNSKTNGKWSYWNEDFPTMKTLIWRDNTAAFY